MPRILLSGSDSKVEPKHTDGWVGGCATLVIFPLCRADYFGCFSFCLIFFFRNFAEKLGVVIQPQGTWLLNWKRLLSLYLTL